MINTGTLIHVPYSLQTQTTRVEQVQSKTYDTTTRQVLQFVITCPGYNYELQEANLTSQLIQLCYEVNFSMKVSAELLYGY